VVGRVIADDVDERHVAAPGVVEIGPTIGETGPQMQERRGGSTTHARESVGGARRDTFKETEHPAHLRRVVERRHEVHLGRSGIGEADVDLVGRQGREQRAGAVHGRTRGGLMYVTRANYTFAQLLT
jgi:hypothetical protein